MFQTVLLALLAATATVTTAVALQTVPQPDDTHGATRVAEQVQPLLDVQAEPASEVDPLALPVYQPAGDVQPDWRVDRVALLDGESFADALTRYGVGPDVAEAIDGALGEAGIAADDVRASDRMKVVRLGGDDLVARVSYSSSPWSRFDVSPASGTWRATARDVQPEVRLEVYHGEVRDSLSDAIAEGGVEPHVARQFAHVLSNELDLVSESRPGDRYRLLVEALYSDGDLVDHGRVLAAQYLSDGETVTGVAFEIDGRVLWYDQHGESLRRTFLQAPVEFSRISSGYTERRKHPILGGIRPHLAIDYAAPTGTPVWAVADGVVKSAARDLTNGIQVVLQHRNGYETYYNHLSRVAKGLKAGQRVAQRQVIGYVGSTGLSTGPHLCYRVAKDGVYVNPLSDEFMPGEPLADAVRPQFEALVRSYLEQLAREAPFEDQAADQQAQVSGDAS